jgi:hypothetical protein
MGFVVKREGVYSTGLTNTAYFDWATRAKKLNSEFKPDIIICFFGSNDGQRILDKNGTYHNFATPQWDAQYALNVNNFLQVSKEENLKKMYYIGLPISSKNDFSVKYKRINELSSKQVLDYENIYFVDACRRFAPNGKYATLLKDAGGRSARVKYEDGIHLTDHGSIILLEEVEKFLKIDVEY